MKFGLYSFCLPLPGTIMWFIYPWVGVYYFFISLLRDNSLCAIGFWSYSNPCSELIGKSQSLSIICPQNNTLILHFYWWGKEFECCWSSYPLFFFGLIGFGDELVWALFTFTWCPEHLSKEVEYGQVWFKSILLLPFTVRLHQGFYYSVLKKVLLILVLKASKVFFPDAPSFASFSQCIN